jgi:hypothetical protein
MTLASEYVQAGISGPQAVAFGGGAQALAATGSTQGNAALIGASSVIVTAADGTKGVILPAGMPGDEVDVINNSGSTLKVYPPSGAAIVVPASGMGSANAAYSQTTYSCCTYKCFSATQWSVNKSA